jgi:predicted  nucleic acid-binding Zn-ribbon protein
LEVALKEQLKLLEELQRYDARLQEYENGLKALPEKLQALKGDLAKVEAMLERERTQLADAEKFRRDQEFELKNSEGGIAKSKTKLGAVKTGKDYMAAQREVETARKTIAEREEEILKLGEAIEANRAKVVAHEADVAQLREVVSKEEAITNGKMDELRAKIAGEKSGRDASAARVDANVLKKYSAIRMRRGLAVVPVVKGTCQGCHMKIPPQLFIMLQRGTAIETCPTCARIIYWDEIMKEAQLEEGEKDSASS